MAKKKKNKLQNISTKEVFNRIIWPKRGMLLFGLVLILLRSAATIIPPKATQYLIDDVDKILPKLLPACYVSLRFAKLPSEI